MKMIILHWIKMKDIEKEIEKRFCLFQRCSETATSQFKINIIQSLQKVVCKN